MIYRINWKQHLLDMMQEAGVRLSADGQVEIDEGQVFLPEQEGTCHKKQLAQRSICGFSPWRVFKTDFPVGERPLAVQSLPPGWFFLPLPTL